jgi:hypothetical protein
MGNTTHKTGEQSSCCKLTMSKVLCAYRDVFLCQESGSVGLYAAWPSRRRPVCGTREEDKDATRVKPGDNLGKVLHMTFNLLPLDLSRRNETDALQKNVAKELHTVN